MAENNTVLFVRNLTKDTTRAELAQAFADIGPLKHAIIIHDRHGGPSKGFGFVTFALRADAEEAIKRPIIVKGNRVRIDWASDEKKEPQTPKSSEDKKGEDQQELHVEEAVAEDNGKVEIPNATKVVDWKTKKDELRRLKNADKDVRERSVVLFNVPTDVPEYQMKKRIQKRTGGLVERVERDEANSGVVRILYKSADDVPAAVKELSGRDFSGARILARRGVHVFDTTVARTKCRLIIRNLGFHIKEKHLETAFGEHGPLQEVVIRKGDDGKSKGFAFVQFYTRSDAHKAVEALNASTELGPKKAKTPVAVDFALAKDRYESLKQRGEDKPSTETSQAPTEEPIEEGNEEPEEKSDIESASSTSSSSSSEENDSNDGEKESAQEGEEEEEAATETESFKGGSTADKGVREGRTLFVRNLLFETTEESIRKRFTEFGPVRGVKLIRDQSGRSKGTGFVEFWSKESCDRSLEADELTLEGRVIYVNRAVDKSSAERLRNETEQDDGTKKKIADKRHLYLAAEGRVPADKVPNVDKKKRLALEDEKRTKLKNPLFFVSPTRLSVKNLNRKEGETMEAKELRKLFKDAAIMGIRERVVKDGEGDPSLFPANGARPSVKVLKATVFHESKDDRDSRNSGFAFVELSEHAHALGALRILNNNPEFAWAAAGGKQAMKLPAESRPRLIVSFAIENASKVRAQKLRLEKSMKATPPAKHAQDGKSLPVQAMKGEMSSQPSETPESQTRIGRKRTLSTDNDESSIPASKDVKKQPKIRGLSAKKPRQEQNSEKESKVVEHKSQQPRNSREKRDISNRAFEKKVRKRPKTSDDLDSIVAKRSNLFEIPEAESKSKRWFDD